jgi:hypothetical protein
MNTSFTISCKNWNDPDAPLTYEFSYQSNGVRIVLSYLTAPSGAKVTSTDWLPIGDQENDFELIVTVQVKDKFGSNTKQDCVVKVNLLIITITTIITIINHHHYHHHNYHHHETQPSLPLS